jgi:putative heme degradation protein
MMWRLLVGESEFATDLRRRLRDARQAFDQARAEGDYYAVDVRTGELDSLMRSATENGIDVTTAHGAAAGQSGEQ